MDKPSENLIFDRTQRDVAINNVKGQYNASDLNRVETWCEYLKTELADMGYNIDIETKTNWTQTDMRTASEMERIRSNIKKLKAGFNAITSVNATAENFDWQKANNWEKVLDEIYWLMFGTRNYYVYGGVARGGQPRLYQNRFRHFFGHTEVEYIESTGTQYIETNVLSQKGVLIQMGIEPKASATGISYFFGNTDSGSPYVAVGTSGLSQKWATRFANEILPSVSTQIFNYGVKYNLELAVTNNDHIYLDVNYNRVRETDADVGSSGTAKLKIFGTTSEGNKFSMKLYYCKIYVNGTLTEDLIPVVYQGRACLFDKVSKTYLYNAGTGDFLYKE